MNAIKYLKEKAKMTRADNALGECCVACKECPFSWDNNGHNLLCSEFEALYCKEAVAIVKKWSRKNKGADKNAKA